MAQLTNGADLKRGQTLDILGHYYRVIQPPVDDIETLIPEAGHAQLIPNITKSTQSQLPLSADRKYFVLSEEEETALLIPTRRSITKGTTTTATTPQIEQTEVAEPNVPNAKVEVAPSTLDILNKITD